MAEPLPEPAPALQPPVQPPPALQPPALQPPALQPPALQPPARQPSALPGALAGRTPDEILAFLRGATDDELRDAVHGIGTTVVLDLLFSGMAQRFGARPERAVAQLAFVLNDEGVEHTRVLSLDPAGARLVPAADRPRATVRTTLVRFLRVAAGAADAKVLLLTRRLRISGDPLWAAATLAGLGAAPVA